VTARADARLPLDGTIVVFDLETIADRATYKDSHQLAEGIAHVVLNGKLTGPGVLAGRVLRP